MALDLARESFIELEPVLDEVHGIWDDEPDDYTRYRVSLTFKGKIMGGVPQKPEAIEAWIRQRITGGDAEVQQAMRETLIDLGADLSKAPTMEEMKEAAKHFVAENHANTFRRDTNGLFISDYQLKAAIKENVNVLYAGDRWGKTKKGPKAFVAERVFVDEERVYLGKHQIDGTHLQVGHVSGPRGPRSTLTYYDYCVQPTITFTLSSLNDEVEAHQWKSILQGVERNGVGAIRSLGYGQCKVTDFGLR